MDIKTKNTILQKQCFIYKSVFFLVFLAVQFNGLSQGIFIGPSASIATTGNPSVYVLNGDFINNGTYTTSAGNTIIIDGAIPQNIGGTGITTCFNLDLRGSSTKTISADTLSVTQDINISGTVTAIVPAKVSVARDVTVGSGCELSIGANGDLSVGGDLLVQDGAVFTVN